MKEAAYVKGFSVRMGTMDPAAIAVFHLDQHVLMGSAEHGSRESVQTLWRGFSLRTKIESCAGSPSHSIASVDRG